MHQNTSTNILLNVDDNGNTLLHRAVLKDYIDSDKLLELLMNKEVDVNAKNNHGQTALHLAANRPNIKSNRPNEIVTLDKLVRLLLNKGVHANAKDDYGNTALHLAVARESDYFLSLYNYKRIDFSDNVVISSYFRSHDFHMVATLARACDINKRNFAGQTALHVAAGCDSVQVVMALLAARADINSQDDNGNTALHCTLNLTRDVRCFIPVLKMLLDKGGNVDIRNMRGETISHLFIDFYFNNQYYKWQEDLKFVLSSGVNVNLRDEKGETCLIRAVRKRFMQVGVEHILEHGALINLTDNEGNSALHHAALSKFQPMMRTLIAAGADSNLQNNHGKTPFHLLFHLHDRYNNFEIKDLLELALSHGFDVNVQDHNGDTLLHLGTKSYWHDELMNVLLVKGARIDTENRKGQSVADLYVRNLYRTCSDVDMIRLTEAGIKYYMTDGIKTTVNDTLRSDHFKTSCLKELARMKKTKIGSIFTKYGDPVFVSDEELNQLVTSGILLEQFPIYGILLVFTYEKAKCRNHLLDVLSYNFDISENFGTLVSEIKRIIFSFLTDKDLFNLLQAIGLQQNSTLLHVS